jgi:hypothetical protein
MAEPTERLNIWSVADYADIEQMSITSAIAKLQVLSDQHGPTARLGEHMDTSLEVLINRPETDAEMHKRLGLIAAYEKQFEVRDRAQYELLKTRFEPK